MVKQFEGYIYHRQLITCTDAPHVIIISRHTIKVLLYFYLTFLVARKLQ